MTHPARAPRTAVIAEIGENHLGRLDLALRMLEEAARAGADIVKFQSYRGGDVDPGDPEREWFSQVELTDDMHRQLKRRAEELGIQFLSSPFTVERARFLCEDMSLRSVKIASSEILNLPLLDYVNPRVETVYLSTGMSTLEEVSLALGHLDHPRVVILHCVTQYPARDEDANLLAIPTLQEAFPERAVGYSDHTTGIEAAVAAAALGAAVVEKHFTLSKNLPGTDHVLSATPEELAEMIRRIRRVEGLLGSGSKEPAAAEREIRDAVRSRWRKQEASPSRAVSAPSAGTGHCGTHK